MKYKIIGLFILTAVIFYGAVSFSYATSPIPYEGDTFTRNLTIGSLGYEVVALQSWLEQKGFLTMPAGVQKGYFGGLTRAALIKFQLSQGITPPVGYFGPITRGILNALNKPDKKIKVISPNGGDVIWGADGNYLISWNNAKINTPITISLISASANYMCKRDGGIICPLDISRIYEIGKNISSNNSSGSYLWLPTKEELDNMGVGQKFYINVCQESTCDDSDNPFTLGSKWMLFD